MPIEGDRMKMQYQYQTDLGMLYIVQEDDAIAEVGATGNTLDQCLNSMKYLAKVMDEISK